MVVVLTVKSMKFMFCKNFRVYGNFAQISLIILEIMPTLKSMILKMTIKYYLLSDCSIQICNKRSFTALSITKAQEVINCGFQFSKTELLHIIEVSQQN